MWNELTFKPVLTKKDFVIRYKAGEFGNASPTWDSFTEFNDLHLYQSDVLFHLRNRVAGGVTHYNQTWPEAAMLWFGKKDWGQWYVSEMAPHHLNLIQGEVMQGTRGLELFYSTVNNLPMRDALAAKSHSTHSIMAGSLLRHYLCPNSYEWMQELLTRYPGHVVEFSTFSRCWGTLPRFNTIFWEVRSY